MGLSQQAIATFHGKKPQSKASQVLKTQALQGGESIKGRMLKTTYQILEQEKDQGGKRKVQSEQWDNRKIYNKPVMSAHAVG